MNHTDQTEPATALTLASVEHHAALTSRRMSRLLSAIQADGDIPLGSVPMWDDGPSFFEVAGLTDLLRCISVALDIIAETPNAHLNPEALALLTRHLSAGDEILGSAWATDILATAEEAANAPLPF